MNEAHLNLAHIKHRKDYGNVFQCTLYPMNSEN